MEWGEIIGLQKALLPKKLCVFSKLCRPRVSFCEHFLSRNSWNTFSILNSNPECWFCGHRFASWKFELSYCAKMFVDRFESVYGICFSVSLWLFCEHARCIQVYTLGDMNVCGLLMITVKMSLNCLLVSFYRFLSLCSLTLIVIHLHGCVVLARESVLALCG